MTVINVLNKIVYLLLISFVVVIIVAVARGALEHPERELVGVWKEVEWTYEKVDRSRGSSAVQKDILRDRLKNQITEDLIIHKSETWEFKKNGDLILKKSKMDDVTLKWYMKGRGHILKMKHNSGALEFYQIRSISDDELVLHFENDNHARGIVKIVFKRIQ